MPRPRAGDRAPAGEPRVPHLDRGAGERAAAPHARTSRAPTRRCCRSSPMSPATSIRPAPTSRPRCSTCWPDRSPRRCSSSPGSAASPMPAPVSSSKSARSGRSAASSPTSSATTRRSSTSPPTTRRSVTLVSFNQALCGLYAAGLGDGRATAAAAATTELPQRPRRPSSRRSRWPRRSQRRRSPASPPPNASTLELGHLFADFLDRGRAIYAGTTPVAPSPGPRRRRSRSSSPAPPSAPPAPRASSTTPTSASC